MPANIGEKRNKKYRYFFGILELEKNWLNKIARKGWRLEEVNHHNYQFVGSAKKINYDIDVLWDKSIDEINEYTDFLHKMGCKTFRDGLNQNLSLGRVKYRAGGNRWGHFDNNRGKLNREILIIEKENEVPIYTSKDDIYQYYKHRSDIYLFPTFLAGSAMLDACSTEVLFEFDNIFSFIFLLSITLFFCFFLIYFRGKMCFMKHKRQIEE